MCNIFRNKLKNLKDAICTDIDHLNSCCIGTKTKLEEENFDKWQAKGVSEGIGDHAYVYRHNFHTIFSAIEHSQLKHAAMEGTYNE